MYLKTGMLLSLNQGIIGKCADIKCKHYYANAHSYNLKIDGLLVVFFFLSKSICTTYHLSGQLDVICFVKYSFFASFIIYI